MRLSIATNFDDRLIEAVQGSPVMELFGKLARDPLGGGRASYMLTPVSRRRLARHVQLAHRHGLRFNYLLNAACWDNLEWSRRGQRRLEQLLDWLSEQEINGVTVALPYLCELIKRRYPHFTVTVSVFAGVDSVSKAKWWEDLGADCITLESLTVNRNFRLLTQVRKAVHCDLQLLANTNCLYACPLARGHMVALSHASQRGHPSRGFIIDYCLLQCTRSKLIDPVNYLRSDWIRPEDLRSYQALGYDRFKLAERNLPTDVMISRVKAYSEERYDGNLLDLIQGWGFRCAGPGYYRRGLFWSLGTFLRPLRVNPFRLLKVKRVAERLGMLSPRPDEDPPVVVDNRALDGFLDGFRRRWCQETDCDRCQYCHEAARLAVRINPAFRRQALNLMDDLLEELVSGHLWRWRRRSHRRT